MNQDLSIKYSTPSDREGVVAEIWSGKSQVAEICPDPGYLAIEIYQSPSGQPWKFKLEDLRRIFLEAAKGLGKKEVEDKDKELASLRLQVERLSSMREKELEDDRRALLSAVR